jgi:hypothetical protein
MQMQRIAIAVTAVLVFASLGGAAAIAATPASTAPRSPAGTQTTDAGAQSAPDPDTVQSGDQTSPDTGTEAGGEAETGGESTGESDGPGGHEDPAGTADHQFDGQE